MSIEALHMFAREFGAKIEASTELSKDAQGALLAEVNGFEAALDKVLDQGSVTIVGEFDKLRKALKIASEDMRAKISETFIAHKAANDEMIGNKVRSEERRVGKEC